MAKLEIACFNTQSAYIAAANGAHRIEFCDGWEWGGTTPTEASLIRILKDLTVDITVMIRPRGGDFNYSPEEFENMRHAIERFRELPVSGFVFGILNPDLSIDKGRCSELIKCANGTACVLHRAFDKTPDMALALEETIACGFTSILTSGHASDVMTGAQNLKKLVAVAADRIHIMPGGGIRSQNINEIKEVSKAIYYHSSAIVDQTGIADAEEVKALLNNLKS